MFLPVSGGLGHLFGAEAVHRFLTRAKLSLILRGHPGLKLGSELLLEDQVLDIASNCHGGHQAGVAILSGKEYATTTWAIHASIKRNDVVYVTSIDSNRFTVHRSLSATTELALTSEASLPACPGLRLTISRTGMSKPIRPTAIARSSTGILSRTKNLIVPSVNTINVSFAPDFPFVPRA
jgi:hypothetical protein